jgi:hypothetical protein
MASSGALVLRKALGSIKKVFNADFVEKPLMLAMLVPALRVRLQRCPRSGSNVFFEPREFKIDKAVDIRQNVCLKLHLLVNWILSTVNYS